MKVKFLYNKHKANPPFGGEYIDLERVPQIGEQIVFPHNYTMNVLNVLTEYQSPSKQRYIVTVEYDI